VALAGRLRWQRQGRPKIAVYVPDIEPGLALKLTARLADKIMLTVEDSMEFFENRSNLMVTGYPTRLSFEKSQQKEALANFSLSPDLVTLLVFGGSKGARSINRALISILPDLLSSMQVIHISGQLDWSQIEKAERHLPADMRSRYRAYPYLHNEMGDALQAADFAVSRAGASVLGEFPLYGLPAILVPYPHAWRYQEVNAHYLEARGAALVMQDHELDVHLLATIKKIVNDKKTRDEMSQAMSSLAAPTAAESIATLLQNLVTVPSSGRI
jgi:UDP-N-acetylglucosamine:LPS N-acetylglucosamine transferase